MNLNLKNQEIQTYQKSDIICVIGRRGSGKTTLVIRLLLPLYQPFIIYDSIGEYADVQNCASADSLSDFFDLLESRDNIRITPESKIPFDMVCNIIDSGVINYTLIVDEFHLIYEHHMSFAADYPAFKRLILLGRHKGIGVVVISQRPTDIPKYVLSQCSRLYCFHVYHRQDILFLSNVLNDAKIANTLDLYEFFEISLDSPIQITRKKLNF